MGAVISPIKKQEVLPFLQSNLGRISQREIGRRLDIGKTTINRWSKELGFKNKKHTVNENFFNKFNEKSAYVLGYIFADGNINWNPKKSYRALTITASEKDKKHLEKIRNFILTTKPLLYSRKTKSYRLIVNNRKLCQKLMKMGVVPRKSLSVKFPKIPKSHLKHFIRGVIDGDGTIRYVNRKKSPYFEIQVCSGSYIFLKRLVELINRNIGVDAKMRRNGKNTFLVQYSCTRGRNLADWLYTNATIFLERKNAPYKFALGVKGGGVP